MKAFKSLCLLLCALFLQVWTQTASAQTSTSETDDTLIPIDAAHFPDPNFRAYVEEKYDYNGNQQLSQNERDLWEINYGEFNCSYQGISSLEGIQYFSNLMYLNCSNNQISSLNLFGCSQLFHLDCYDNQLSSLDLSHCPELEYLECYDNQISSLDLSGFSLLQELECYDNQLSSLDLSDCRIQHLKCYSNQLSSLDLSKCTDLTTLHCYNNQLSSLDLSNCTDLTDLKSYNNQRIVTLDANNCIDIAVLPGFDPNRASNWEGGQLEGTRLQFTQDEVSYTYETGYQGEAELPEVRFLLRAKNVTIDEINFPDEIFRTYVSEHLDSSANGYLDDKEADISVLDISGLGIRDLQGIEYFSELENLDCSDNELTSLDLSKNPALQVLNAEDNQLDITLDANDGFDLSTLPGFDVSKASDWEGGICQNNILTFNEQEVTYAYATGYNGNTEDESLQSVRFSLRADRDPGVANESIEVEPQGRVYAKDHVIHIEGIGAEITVFTPSGILLYRGHDQEIPVRNDGVYIVRSGQQVWKVLVI